MPSNTSIASVQSVAGDLHISTDEAARLLAEMEAAGYVVTTSDNFELTPAGESAALHIIRAHRLLEMYLAENSGYSEDEWHTRAHDLEHELPDQELEHIARRLGNPLFDPHGDPIPDPSGAFVPHGGQPLPECRAGYRGRIVHIEDEPAVVYSQLVALGLNPGQEIHILENTPQRIRFWVDGNEHVLSPLLARNITVRQEEKPVAGEAERYRGMPLCDLGVGEEAEIVSLAGTTRASERRRLMDLGILPGTRVKVAFRSPGNDPTAYLVRDTLIALRREQAQQITTRRLEEVPA